MVRPSEDFDYVLTRNKIVAAALRICGALDPNQNPSAAMSTQGREALQLLVKSWQNKHVFLWSLSQASFNTIANQTEYNNDSGIVTGVSQDLALAMGIEKAWIINDDDTREEIQVISYSRYLSLRDTEATVSEGKPKAVAFKRTWSTDADAANFHAQIFVYPSPDAVYVMNVLAVYPLKDFDTAAGHGDLPVEFQRALKYGLAEDLFDEYPGPMNEREYIQGKAAQLFAEAARRDTPVETVNEVASLFDE